MRPQIDYAGPYQYIVLVIIGAVIESSQIIIGFDDSGCYLSTQWPIEPSANAADKGVSRVARTGDSATSMAAPRKQLRKALQTSRSILRRLQNDVAYPCHIGRQGQRAAGGSRGSMLYTGLRYRGKRGTEGPGGREANTIQTKTTT
jgi:hypothetical protein